MTNPFCVTAVWMQKVKVLGHVRLKLDLEICGGIIFNHFN